MTESEWLASTDPMPMLGFLRGRTSERKLRLFAVACCRCLGHLITDRRGREAVEVAERFAEGRAGKGQMAEARRALKAEERGLLRAAVMDAARAEGNPEVVATARAVAWAAAWDAAHYAVRAVGWDSASLCAQALAVARIWGRAKPIGVTDEATLLRDIFCNPFRPVKIDPAWLAWDGGNIRRMASAIYDERAFDQMPFLADALEDAGCDDQDILQHCRSRSEHVRGCWVLDALLGRS